MPNNRQWATLFWIAIIAVWALSRRDVRSHFRDIVRTVAGPKLLAPLALMGAWVCLEVWGGARAALWKPALSTDTAFWFISSGLVLFANFEEASKRSDFFRKKAIAAFAPAVLMEAFLDEFALSLPAEIILQFTLAFFVMLAAVASRMEERHRPVASVANVLAGLIVLGYLAAAVFQLISGWGGLDKADLLRQAILPGWLTIGLVPVIYLIALYAAYELAFMRVDHFAGTTRTRWPIKLALLSSLHVKATEIASFAGLWPQRLATAVSFSEARTSIQQFRSSKAEQRRAHAEAEARLARYTGVDGVDENGRRLDRREFSETMSALLWLSTCMMGWYRHQDRYQADLLRRLGDDFVRQWLPKPSGITMHVHDNGQSWYAWRRTVTGWCFAVGAAGPPPEQWEYDGPEPPAGFPGEDPAWGSRAFSQEANRNW